MTEPGRRHWILATGVAALLHAGVLVAVLWEGPDSGARSFGTGGIEISLGPAGAAPGSVASAAPAEAADVAEPETVEPRSGMVETADSSPPETATSVPVDAANRVEPAPALSQAPRQVDTAVVETVAAVDLAPETTFQPPDDVVAARPEPEPVREPEPETAPVEETVDVDPPQAVEVEQVEATLSKDVPPIPQPPREVEREISDAKPRDVEARTPPTPAPPSETPPDTVAVTAPSAAGAGGRSGTRTQGDTGDANASTGGGRPGEMMDYMTLLKTWLERHKEYPRMARRRRQEGTAVLYFVVGRDGIVLNYDLRESSGYDVLDREVREMIERAQPLPKMPDSMQQASLELVLPVQFQLR